MNTPTPRTYEALAAILERDGYLSEDNAPDLLVKLCRTMELERDKYREQVDALVDRLDFQEKLNRECVDQITDRTNERDELRAQLREEQQLHVKTLDERDEARQWESQALVARIQRDQFSKTLGEVREILCDAMPNENAPTSFMAATLVKERDEAQKQLLNLWKP